MFSVMFEVHPYPQRFDAYLALAGRLKPLLERVDGFLENERFASLARPGWLLSHSTWRDEKSLVRWRSDGQHHGVQGQGRAGIFQDYRLRVGEIAVDAAPAAALQVQAGPLEQRQAGAAQLVTLTEFTLRQDAASTSAATALAAFGLPTSGIDVVEHDVFASITQPAKRALLVSWADALAGQAWRPGEPEAGNLLRHRAVRIVRQYGMFDRHEAPQFHPPVPRR